MNDEDRSQTRHMTWRPWTAFIPSVIIVFFMLAAASAPAAEMEGAPKADKGADPPGKEAASGRTIVAKVGDAEITEADLQEAVQEKVKTMYSHGKDLTQKPEYRRDALNGLIDVELLSHEAVKRGMKIPEDFIDGVVEQNRMQLGTEKGLDEVLTSRGMTMGDFRNRIRKYRLANDLLRDLFEKSRYPDEELKQYYEKHKASFMRPDSVHLFHILVKVEPTATEQQWQMQKERAEGILKRIQAGEDFYDIAYSNSDDGYRVKGGDLGFIHKGRLTPQELEDVAFSLKPGEVSGVIRALDGFHIMKAGERKPGELVDFDTAKEGLAKKLQQQRFEDQKASILKSMRDAYPVKVYIPFNDTP